MSDKGWGNFIKNTPNMTDTRTEDQLIADIPQKSRVAQRTPKKIKKEREQKIIQKGEGKGIEHFLAGGKRKTRRNKKAGKTRRRRR